jgi:pSer/pThr/pTyr-binding forkhead associated (FHA) protein
MSHCPECSFEIRQKWNYCPNCGYPLTLAASIPPTFLEFIGGPEDGRTAPLQRARVRIGRRDDNEIAIRSDPSVSRQHASLSYRGDTFWLADLGSKLGTRLGSELVSGEQPLYDGDIITLGRTRLIFCLGAATEPEARPRLLELGPDDG